MTDKKDPTVDNDILTESAWLTDGKKMFRMAVLAAIFGPIGFGAAGVVSYATAKVTGQWEKLTVPWTLKPTLDYLISITPPPAVVIWDEDKTFQLGSCTTEYCPFQLTGARSEYGMECGNVTSAHGELRIPGKKIIDFPYGPDFKPVKLDLIPESFVVPLNLQNYIDAGEFEWRSVAEYENCEGPKEPIERFSPWWPLTVSPKD